MIRIKRLCLAMIAVLWCSITVNAYDFVVDDICYNITSNNTVEVTQKWDSYSGEIVIPSIVSYDGASYKVTGIGVEAFRGCSGLTSVEIPNSIMDIGEFAFSYCESLTSIEIPNSITTLKSGVFAYCRNLEDIKIPNSVTSLGVIGDLIEGPFEGCVGLVNVNIPDNVAIIGDCAFNFCTNLVSVTIPCGVTSIGGAAFNHCI